MAFLGAHTSKIQNFCSFDNSLCLEKFNSQTLEQIAIQQYLTVARCRLAQYPKGLPLLP